LAQKRGIGIIELVVSLEFGSSYESVPQGFTIFKNRDTCRWPRSNYVRIFRCLRAGQRGTAMLIAIAAELAQE
jgi:hypothetical protein